MVCLKQHNTPRLSPSTCNFLLASPRRVSIYRKTEVGRKGGEIQNRGPRQ